MSAEIVSTDKMPNGFWRLLHQEGHPLEHAMFATPMKARDAFKRVEDCVQRAIEAHVTEEGERE